MPSRRLSVSSDSPRDLADLPCELPRARRGETLGDENRDTTPHNVASLDSGAAPPWLTPKSARTVRAAEDLPFDDAEYETRLASVRHRMARAGLDALVVFRPSSIEYLCGYHTAETAPQPFLVTETDTYLYVPDLEVGRALASSRAGNILYCGYADALQGLEQFFDHAVGVVRSGARVGIEMGHTSTPPQAVRILDGRAIDLADSDYLVERVRLVLSPAELRCVEQAALVTNAGVEAAVAEAAEPDATDASVGGAISAALCERADSVSAWGPVVVTGERSGIPHSSWNGRRLTDGPIFVEFSGTHHRYHAPVMRTLMYGGPDATDRRLADLARTAVGAVLEHAKPGVLCSEVATRALKALGPLPDDVMFHQLFGYPVGLAHKPHWMDGVPFHLAEGNHEPLREGMVFHIPGSFRSFGRQGVGLSQTFVVESDGARAVTHGPADLIEIGKRSP